MRQPLHPAQLRAIAVARRHASTVPSPLIPLKAPSAPTPPPTRPKSSLKPISTNANPIPALTYTPPPTPLSTLPKPRLDYPSLLSDPSLTTTNHLLRSSPLPLGPTHVPHLQRVRSTQLLLLQKLQTIKSKQREIGETIRLNLVDKEQSLLQAKKLKAKIAEYETSLSGVEAELLELGLALPNFMMDEVVPIGKEENAIEIERFGPEPIPADTNRDHLRIASHHDLLDNDASVLASGSSWPYLKGALCLLEQALISYALSIAIKHGYKPISTPDVIKADIAWRCGFQPRDPNSLLSQTYHIQTPPSTPELCLTGTAEIPLSALFATKILNPSTLPQKVVGVGKSFRAEAGARGSDTRGLYRVHQFTKVELFGVTEGSVEKSMEIMDEMRVVQREVAEGLGLSVRVLEMPSEELGASAARKWDMEAWMPGRGKWGEITSTSNCTDYQSRRLHIRHRHVSPSTDEANTDQSALPFAHTLNGTAAAIPRLLVALLENGVRLGEGGEIEGLNLPEALKRFWVGGDTVGEGENEGDIRWV